MRNRVKAGWGDGWLSVILSAGTVTGNLPLPMNEIYSTTDRLLQMIARDVDDI